MEATATSVSPCVPRDWSKLTWSTVLPNRINYDMDLRGPSIIIRTACSSTLVALHEACQSIARGDCEAAIVGGVNLIMAPYMTTTMTEQGVLSPDGSCKTFSKEANGYGRGEAGKIAHTHRLDMIRV